MVSQFGFMFFEDPTRALREMVRVLRPGGRLVVAVCDGLDHSPGYAVLTELLLRLFGAEVAGASGPPSRWVTGIGCGSSPSRPFWPRRSSVSTATFASARSRPWSRPSGPAPGPSAACSTTDQFAHLRAAAEESLRPFARPDGSVRFELPGLRIVAGTPVGSETV